MHGDNLREQRQARLAEAERLYAEMMPRDRSGLKLCFHGKATLPTKRKEHPVLDKVSKHVRDLSAYYLVVGLMGWLWQYIAPPLLRVSLDTQNWVALSGVLVLTLSQGLNMFVVLPLATISTIRRMLQ